MKRNRKPSQPRLMRIILVVFVVALLITAIPRTVQVIRLEQKKAELEAEKQELAVMVQEREEQLALTETPEYVEKVAREQLGMIKEGERSLLKATPEK